MFSFSSSCSPSQNKIMLYTNANYHTICFIDHPLSALQLSLYHTYHKQTHMDNQAHENYYTRLH